MPRRTVWLVTGAVAGAASSLYAERRLRRTLEAASARLQPDALVSGVGRTARQAARSTGGRVRDAIADGRLEMHRRQRELWDGLAASGAVSAPDDADAVGTDTDRVVAPAVASPTTAPGDGDAEPASGHRARGRRRRARRSPSHLGK